MCWKHANGFVKTSKCYSSVPFRSVPLILLLCARITAGPESLLTLSILDLCISLSFSDCQWKKQTNKSIAIITSLVVYQFAIGMMVTRYSALRFMAWSCDWCDVMLVINISLSACYKFLRFVRLLFTIILSFFRISRALHPVLHGLIAGSVH